jgi:hypothetical protein
MRADPQPVVGIVRDVVVDLMEAIGDELRALAAADNSAVQLRNGRYIGVVHGDRLWSFDLDDPLPVPPETPGRLVVKGQDPVRVTILAIGDLDIVLGTDEDLGDSGQRARLSTEPWFILDALRGRLGDLLESGGDVPLAEAVLDLSEPVRTSSWTPADATQVPLLLGDDQVHAAGHAAQPGLRFVWGPPGTGKTSTLAATAALLAGQQRSRVLVTAHANAAVDVAITRTADALEGTTLVGDGRVLRVGTPHLEMARNRPEILPDQIIARVHPELIRRRDDLDHERRSLSGRMKAASTTDDKMVLTARLEEVRTELIEIDRRLREARVALVKNAVVIAATLSKLVLDDLLWTGQRGAVIVDEASMSGLPFVVALALRGASTLACFGDFRQLPPIAVSDRESTRRWFGQDVFELAGVVSRFDSGVPDPRLATLRTQYRMGRCIASTVSKFAYFDLLSTPRLRRRAGPADR